MDIPKSSKVMYSIHFFYLAFIIKVKCIVFSMLGKKPNLTEYPEILYIFHLSVGIYFFYTQDSTKTTNRQYVLESLALINPKF